MKQRVYKKLCKKAAVFFGKNVAFDGVHHISFTCGYDDEFDSTDCWPWLVALFDSNVNTIEDDNSECGLSWVDEKLFKKSTPKNVFKWAKENKDLLK